MRGWDRAHKTLSAQRACPHDRSAMQDDHAADKDPDFADARIPGWRRVRASRWKRHWPKRRYTFLELMAAVDPRRFAVLRHFVESWCTEECDVS